MYYTKVKYKNTYARIFLKYRTVLKYGRWKKVSFELGYFFFVEYFGRKMLFFFRSDRKLKKTPFFFKL